MTGSALAKGKSRSDTIPVKTLKRTAQPCCTSARWSPVSPMTRAPSQGSTITRRIRICAMLASQGGDLRHVQCAKAATDLNGQCQSHDRHNRISDEDCRRGGLSQPGIAPQVSSQNQRQYHTLDQDLQDHYDFYQVAGDQQAIKTDAQQGHYTQENHVERSKRHG